MFEKDCATKLKEKQLFKIFPALNQNFLVDIFKDHKWVIGLSVGSIMMSLKAYHFNFSDNKSYRHNIPFKWNVHNIESEQVLAIGSWSTDVYVLTCICLLLCLYINIYFTKNRLFHILFCSFVRIYLFNQFLVIHFF